ncbi:MAG: hypothetical protein K2O00_09450 [Muribaculaceae bacterium]|nr:hypothetical protein [Muribaculaceae bacterium]
MLKRYLICVVALISYCICLADTTICKIGDNGDTVEAQSAEFVGNSKVCVSLANDSNFSAANVTVTIEVTYKYGGSKITKDYSGKIMVHPQSTATLNIPISENAGSSYHPYSVKVISISGTKCKQ